MTTLRFAGRNWDHLLPLALGDIDTRGLDLRFERRDATPNLWSSPELDLAETSFSQYLIRRAAGDDSITALPIFVMSGFRQRCIITRRFSPVESLADLRGCTIGLTGWPDSGNTWTRALLRRAGVEINEAQWRVGRLTEAHPMFDRIGPLGAPVNVAPTQHDGTLTDQLLDGTLDAVMTPFMPPGFYGDSSSYRPLFRDNRAEEISYFRSTGYVPGIHLIGVRTAVIERDPQLAQKLIDIFTDAKLLAAERHAKLQDVVPWLNEAIGETEQVFGPDWLPYGTAATTAMARDFIAEHRAQGTLDHDVTVDAILPIQVEPTARPGLVLSGAAA